MYTTIPTEAYPFLPTLQSFTPMSSSRKMFLLRHPVVVDIGCSCRKVKLSSVFSSSSLQKQRKAHKKYTNLSPSTTSPTTNTTTTTYTNSSFSPSNATSSSPSQAFHSPKQSTSVTTRKKMKKKRNENNSNKKKGVVEESVAVEKESSDPYIDFRDSMLQMIVEKEIYSWDELRASSSVSVP